MTPPDKENLTIYFQLYQSINNLVVSLSNLTNLLTNINKQQELTLNTLYRILEQTEQLNTLHKENYLYKKIVLYQGISISVIVLVIILKKLNLWEIIKQILTIL